MNQPSSSQNTALNALSQSIEGYSGYEKLGQRRQSDIRFRQHLINNTNQLLSQISEIPQAAQPEDQELLDEFVKSTQRKLSTICQSLQNPTYESASFFKSEKLPSYREEHIYDFEQRMKDEVTNLFEEISELSKNSKHRHVFRDHFLHIKDFVDNFNQALFEREALVLGDDY